jgi:hypothetical protein
MSSMVVQVFIFVVVSVKIQVDANRLQNHKSTLTKYVGYITVETLSPNVLNSNNSELLSRRI